jgi:serine protease Do
MSPTNFLTYRSTVLPARIVGVATDVDLAVLKVEAKDLPTLPVAKFTDLRQGELVFAFGSPQGLRNALKAFKPGDPIALQIQRDDRLMFLAFTLD